MIEVPFEMAERLRELAEHQGELFDADRFTVALPVVHVYKSDLRPDARP